ncbi:hypothetical protein [Streptomyces sp. NPDC051132]|uniref:hypothetical protein n=1 Tax=unclassified Streptomyces TaxID=2593676 RepID=UPI0034363465
MTGRRGDASVGVPYVPCVATGSEQPTNEVVVGGRAFADRWSARRLLTVTI